MEVFVDPRPRPLHRVLVSFLPSCKVAEVSEAESIMRFIVLSDIETLDHRGRFEGRSHSDRSRVDTRGESARRRHRY
jgi:hypothetical protein